MSLVRTSRLYLLAACLGVFAFGGDIVADSVAVLRGDHCISESSQSDSHHEKSPCSHCSCAIHNGAVVDSTSAISVNGAFAASSFVSAGDESAPSPVPAAIDHPPQLA